MLIISAREYRGRQGVYPGMMKHILIVILLLAISTSAEAQFGALEPIRLGWKGC